MNSDSGDETVEVIQWYTKEQCEKLYADILNEGVLSVSYVYGPEDPVKLKELENERLWDLVVLTARGS